MQVRAKETCFLDGHRRRAGQVFEFEGTKVPSFLEPIGAVVEEEKPTKKRTHKADTSTSDSTSASDREVI